MSTEGLHNEYECRECGFALWRPIFAFQHSVAGLYADSRYPGRALVSLRRHYDSVVTVPPEEFAGFSLEVQLVCVAVMSVADADRVNVAILGNRVPHVHAHVVPRLASESGAAETIWEDPRPRRDLDIAESERIGAELSRVIAALVGST